jgi:hypothetical protein
MLAGKHVLQEVATAPLYKKQTRTTMKKPPITLGGK